jgi:hypothetical protein
MNRRRCTWLCAVLAWARLTAGSVAAQGGSSTRPATEGPDIEILPDTCSIGATEEAVARERCAWTSRTSFEIRWTAEELQLRVGDTTLRRAGRWPIDQAMRVSVTGLARVTIATVGGPKFGRTVSGRPASSTAADLLITDRRGTEHVHLHGRRQLATRRTIVTAIPDC